MAEDHRGAGAAEERRRAEEARNSQRLHAERIAGRHGERLRHERDDAGHHPGRDERRTDRCERAVDRGPVDDQRRFRKDERDERNARRGLTIDRRRAEREADENENRREPGVEAEKLHARLARNEGEREGDAEAEVGQEEE